MTDEGGASPGEQDATTADGPPADPAAVRPGRRWAAHPLAAVVIGGLIAVVPSLWFNERTADLDREARREDAEVAKLERIEQRRFDAYADFALIVNDPFLTRDLLDGADPAGDRERLAFQARFRTELMPALTQVRIVGSAEAANWANLSVRALLELIPEETREAALSDFEDAVDEFTAAVRMEVGGG